ncbi:pectinesterase family protein [Prevotella copri]|uniref:pectinesterase family protein n=1 Tax=Segatella copri TaxID=165179 RepID=UPI002232AD56|nr:pectinesterase family protein [Segatella copri]MCW4118365.1 pectinesterase family protein [Segatella copri]
MKKNLLRFGLLSLLLVFAFIAKAQDVTAIWDFQHNVPEGINTATNFQGKVGDITSTVDGILLHVDATNGKLKGRTTDAQFNTGTILQVPVKSAKDIVTVTSCHGYHNYTIGGIAATEDATDHKATTAEVAKGYVEVVATGGCYLYNVKVVQVSAIQEKALYTTDFTNWEKIDNTKATDVKVNLKTLYSKEAFTFTFNGVGVDPTGNQAKFPDRTGYMITAKYPNQYTTAEPSAVTSPLASITKITLHQAATGGNRGIKVSVKGDGDDDWVVIHNVSIVKASGEDLTLDVNRTNCQIKFENFALGQNAYVTDLAIYGNVDMSKTPMLGSFAVNGKAYQAADLFEENAEGKQIATILVSKKAKLITESNPLTDLVTANGTIKSTTYTTTGEGANQKTVATIIVEANGDEVTYELTVGFKPDFTLTYYNIDGKTVIGTQAVEQDAEIEAFVEGVENKVTVADGKKFRGWSSSLKQDEKKFTTSSVITSDAALYALVTDIETANATARYDYNFTKEGFDINDHEAISVENGKWHDTTHGWVFESNGKIKVLMGGKGYIKMNLCQYSKTGKITLLDPKGNEVSSIDAKATKDGNFGILQNESTESGEYTLTFEGGDTYIHSLSIVNMTNPAFAQNGNWMEVKAGDAQGFMTALEIANGNNAAANATRTFIFLPNGTYDLGDKCLTTISGNNISIIGESMDNTIIVNNPEVEGIGVTATLFNTSTGLYMQDLTLKNAYPFDKSTGRAVCLQDKGTQTICKNVKMLSYQDTYYSNNNKGQYYFENSDIHGIVDFICGGGDVFFNKCTLTLEPGKGSYITAPYTDGSDYGYVFDGCKIVGSATDSFTFGRSWGGTAKCAFLNTILDKNAAANIASTRWTTGGMNVVAKNFFEYNTVDENGKVISPAENIVKFTKDKEVSEYNTIITAEKAAEFSLDKVFNNWKPADLAAQKSATAATESNGKLAWEGDAQMYIVLKDGKFFAMTAEKSLDIAGATGTWSVRAANEMGGFGKMTSVVTGIKNIAAADEAATVSTAIFSISGAQQNSLQKGINIVVKTLADGSKKTEKVIMK